MDTRARFNTLQTQIRERSARRQDLSINLAVKYGSGNECYAKRSERAPIETLDRQIKTLSDKLYALLDVISPRNWREGVPVRYATLELTYDDATTRAELSTVPPCAWGYQTADMQRFAAPLVSQFDDVRRG